MADVKQPVRQKPEGDLVIDRARDFWAKSGRTILIACAAVIVLGGGWLAYKYLVQAPKEQKAAEAIWKAESYFVADSTQKALKGDGQAPGFEKVMSQYGGTDQANLSRYYAGAIALKSGDFNKAVENLKEFSTSSKLIQARAYKLLADAYASLGKNAEALGNYKKAAAEYEDDQQNSAEYLYLAAYFADRVMNDKKQAVDLYKELKQKYPNTQFGFEADKFLAQAGVYKIDK
ncbi:MAG TPA: tetratricopeptide repeat protein [Flavisolibacter sp.]|nr:tetratricopeptide repeat protein [Flavisolibacter sp.]